MTWANSDSKLVQRWARLCPPLVGLILGITPELGAQEPLPLVTIGGKAPPVARLREALRQCHESAPELALSRCLDQYWVPRWLLNEQAKAEHLDETKGFAELRKRVLSTRLLEQLEEQVDAPTQQKIESYLEEHKRDFEKPLRIRIFRILVSTEDKAKKLLEKLSKTTTLADFRSLCREHSIDRATNERAGDLGFVWPDGSTDIPQVSAEPSLYEAAATLEDGQFSAEPVPEGKHFAVLWRRGSLPAESLTESSRQLVRLRIQDHEAERKVGSLLLKLEKQVSGRDDELLGKLRRPDATLFREP